METSFLSRTIPLASVEAYTMSWPPLKKTILQGLWNAALALEEQAATVIPQQTILDVVEAVAAMEDEGVQVDWIDREIKKFLRPRTVIGLHRMLIS